MAAPVNITLPLITGTPDVGETLSVTDGTWDVVPDSFAYQWMRNGSDIIDADAADYLLVAADAGATITAEVTATNVDGSTPAVASGIGPVGPAAPANTSPPVVTGNAFVNSLLTCDPGTWTPAGVMFEYQWYAGEGVAQPIVDATDSEYIIQPEQLGMQIACLVTGSNASGSAPVISNWVGPVTYRPLTSEEQYRLFLARYSYPRPGPHWTG